MYQKMIHRKTSKKGFTLVEVIVVLVILAILAAIMIPSMTKWIDKARDKSIIVEARAALLAAQTLVSEAYGQDGAYHAPSAADIKTLAGVDGTPAIQSTTVQITDFTYTQAGTGGKTATYDADGTEVWKVS